MKKRREKYCRFFWEYRKLVYELILSLSSGSNNIMIRGRLLLNERLAIFSGWRYDTGGVLFSNVGILMSRVFGVVWGSRRVVWGGWGAVDISRFLWVIPTMMTARSEKTKKKKSWNCSELDNVILREKLPVFGMSLFSGFLTWAYNQGCHQHKSHNGWHSPKYNSVGQLQLPHTSFQEDVWSCWRVDIALFGIDAARHRHFFAVFQVFVCAPIFPTFSSATMEGRLHFVPQKGVHWVFVLWFIVA